MVREVWRGRGVNRLLSLTRYQEATCDGGNPCARQERALRARGQGWPRSRKRWPLAPRLTHRSGLLDRHAGASSPERTMTPAATQEQPPLARLKGLFSRPDMQRAGRAGLQADRRAKRFLTPFPVDRCAKRFLTPFPLHNRRTNR
jgi:hypothetical protein